MNARITLRILDKEHQDCSLNTLSKLRSSTCRSTAPAA